MDRIKLYAMFYQTLLIFLLFFFNNCSDFPFVAPGVPTCNLPFMLNLAVIYTAYNNI